MRNNRRCELLRKKLEIFRQTQWSLLQHLELVRFPLLLNHLLRAVVVWNTCAKTDEGIKPTMNLMRKGEKEASSNVIKT